MFRWCLLGLLVIWQVQGGAEPLQSPRDHRDLIVERAWLDDPSGRLGPDQVQSMVWTPYTRSLRRGFTSSTTWLRLRIDPSVSQGRPSSDRAAQLVLRMMPGHLDELALFDPRRTGQPPLLAGDRQDWRQSQYRSFNQNFVIAYPAEPIDLFLRLRTSGNHGIHVEAMVWEDVEAIDRQQQLIFGAVIMFLMIILVWAITAWLDERERLIGVFIVQQVMSVLFTLSVLGFFHVYLSDWLSASMIDQIHSAIYPLTATSVLWFHWQKVAQMSLAMTWDEWVRHDAVALAELVRRGDVTPAELAAQAAAGVALINPAVHAVVEVFEDVVADPLLDGMNPEGPFAGVPFFMKDLGPTMKGRLQEMGSLMMRGNRASADTFLTGQMRRAGLNIIGRTTTPEFGVCSSAENPAVYVTRNPWNPDYTSYGSSAGTAVALAAGVLPLSHATDGGGSIRIPAGVNGNIGLKPSRGVFSIAPAASDLTGLVSTQGCQSRTVRDTAAFVDHCRGGAPGEFMPYWTPPEPYSQLIGRDPARLRIALSHEWGDFRAVPHFVAELERVGRFLEGLGHQVDWALPEVDFRAAFEAQTTCYISNFSQTISNLLAPRGLQRPPADLVEPINIKIWEMGLNTSFTERARMQAVFNTTSRAFGQFFEDWDIILTPITALPTPKMGTVEYLTISDNPSVLDWFNHLWCNFAYTPLTNLCGMPGISMPMATQENGLPLGIHTQARQANDGLLLQLAGQIERALGGQWHAGRVPQVHVSRSVQTQRHA